MNWVLLKIYVTGVRKAYVNFFHHHGKGVGLERESGKVGVLKKCHGNVLIIDNEPLKGTIY